MALSATIPEIGLTSGMTMHSKKLKNSVTSSEARHFLFGCDPNMLEPMVVVWAGIHRHMHGEELVFHWRAIDVATRLIEEIKTWCRKRNITLHVYDLSGITLKGPAALDYPESTTVRLVSLQELHGVGERLLYLDADLIILADLRPLFEIPLNGYPCAACVDSMIGRDSRNQTLGLPPDATYFNSGVIVIDVAAWTRDRISERSVQFLQQNPGLCQFLDQDALNATLCGHYAPVDERFNRFSLLEKSTRDWDAGRWAVIHFAAQPKPWHLKKLEPRHLERATYYWKLAQSGLRPAAAVWVFLWLSLRNLFHRAVAGGLDMLSQWRQRITPSCLEEGYRRLRSVLTRGKWK